MHCFKKCAKLEKKRIGENTMAMAACCGPCLLEKQRLACSDEGYLEEVREIVENRRDCDSPPYLVYLFQQAYERRFGKGSPYGGVKKQYNDLVLSMEDDLREKLRKNDDPLATSLVMARIGAIQAVVAALAVFAGASAMAEVKDGTTFRLGTVPTELVAERRMGEPVLFSLEENASTGFKWAVESNTNECTVVLKHRGGDKGATCGAPGLLDVTVTSLVRTPVRVEFRYRRPWEKDVEPWKTLRLVVNTVSGEKQTPLTK